jgi:hypothetical protein
MRFNVPSYLVAPRAGTRFGAYLTTPRFQRFGAYLTQPRATRFGALGDDASSSDSTSSAVATTTPGQPDTSWINSLATAATTIENINAQSQLNSINIQRAAAGLSPLPSSVIGPTVSVGLSSDVQDLLIYGGLGFAALYLVSMLAKKRGSATA